MKIKSVGFLIAFTLTLGAWFSQHDVKSAYTGSRSHASHDQPRLMFSVKGDSASGKIFNESGTNLVINVTPCNSTLNLISFHKPYQREDAGEVTCADKTIKLVQVTQQ